MKHASRQTQDIPAMWHRYSLDMAFLQGHKNSEDFHSHMLT